MRICIISGYPPNVGRGAESTFKFVQALSKDKKVNKVIVLANGAQTALNMEESNKIMISRVWSPNSWKCLFKILNCVARTKPDIIHMVYGYLFYGDVIFSAFFTVSLLFMFKLLRKRVIVTIHQVFPIKGLTADSLKQFGVRGPAFAFKLGLTLINKTLSFCAYKITVFCKEHQVTLASSFGVKNVAYIPLFGAKHKNVTEVEAKNLIGISGRNVLLCFGFITPYKGLEYAIQALPKIIRNIPNVLLIIAGTLLPRFSSSSEGRTYVRKLKLLIRDLKLDDHVTFMDKYIPESEVSLYFTASDVVILPYTAQSGPSEVLRSALVHGVPVVASNIDYFRFDVSDSITGLLIPPRHSEKLADAVTVLLTNNELRSKIHENLERVAYDHSVECAVRGYMKLYEEVLSRN